MAEEKKDTPKKKPAATKKPAAKKTTETATKGKGSAASATSKTADKKAASTSTKKAPAKKAPAKKPAAKKTETKAKSDAKSADAKKPAAKKAPAKKEEPAQRPIVNARARFVRVAPRKARLVADQVRGMPIDDARALLRFSTRSAARDIQKLIDSAAANAETNHDLVADDLVIKDIHVDDGPTLRRYRPRALGRATKINKRTSHIAVALTPED
jgi:ribosomal protein L22